MIQKLYFLCEEKLGYTACEVIYFKMTRHISKRADSRRHFNIHNQYYISIFTSQFPQSISTIQEFVYYKTLWQKK